MHPLAVNLWDQPHVLGHILGYEDLTEKHGEWIKEVWTAKKDVWKLAHRGSFKTTSISIVGPIWYHIFQPEDSILLTRKTFSNACDTLDEMAGHYRGGRVREIYRKIRNIPYFKLKQDKRGRVVLPTKTKPTKEGSVDCAGIDASVTGSHYPRQLNDDINTIKDKVSKAEREKTRLYYEEQKNLRNPGGTIAVVGTMWHKEDINHIKTGNTWRERKELSKHPIGTLNIGGFTPDYMRQLQTEMTAAMYACNYDLRIISDQDRKFSDPKYVKWPEQVETTGWLDPAYEGECTTALTLIGSWRREWYAVGFVWNKDATKMGKEIADYLKMWKCGTCYVDSVGDKGYAAKELGEYHPAVTAKSKEPENKHIKIVTHAVANWHRLNWADNESCPDIEYQEYMAQVLDYQENEKPNDAPDSLASLCRELDPSRDEDEDIY